MMNYTIGDLLPVILMTEADRGAYETTRAMDEVKRETSEAKPVLTVTRDGGNVNESIIHAVRNKRDECVPCLVVISGQANLNRVHLPISPIHHRDAK